MAVMVLFRDGSERVLLVNPACKETWLLPGGAAGADESSHAACHPPPGDVPGGGPDRSRPAGRASPARLPPRPRPGPAGERRSPARSWHLQTRRGDPQRITAGGMEDPGVRARGPARADV